MCRCWTQYVSDTEHAPNPRSICASYRIIITIIIKQGTNGKV